VDFLLNRLSESVFINEINTIPGFTEISMFPKLWVHEGRAITEVLDHLIELAMERQEWKMKLKAP
jgi:D-alanine-D-alanine ligase